MQRNLPPVSILLIVRLFFQTFKVIFKPGYQAYLLYSYRLSKIIRLHRDVMSRRKKKQLYILLEGTMRRVTAIYVKDARFQKIWVFGVPVETEAGVFPHRCDWPL